MNKKIFAAISLAALPSMAHANAIIPYLWVPISQLFLFPLVVVVESWLVWRSFKLSFWGIVWRVLVANTASTAAGAALYFSSMPLVGEPLWRIWNKFQTPAAIGISLFIAAILFVVSWLLETAVMARILSNVEQKRISVCVLRANLVTYSVLWLLSVLDA